MIGLLRQAGVIVLERSNIDKSARPSLSGFDLAVSNEARQIALANRQIARGNGGRKRERLKFDGCGCSGYIWPLDTRGPIATPRGLAPAAQESGFHRRAYTTPGYAHDPPGQGSDLPNAVVRHI